MSQRLNITEVVDESMIHIIEPVATQAMKFIVSKLGYDKLMKEVQLVSDFRETSQALDQNHNAKLIDYRTVGRLTPSVNPSNNKWEGTKTTIDLGNGNTLVRQSDANMKKRPWSGHDITSNNTSLFHDDDTFIDLTEWNVASTLALEVKMDFPDLTPAQECLSRIFATFINGDMIGYVPVQYDYPIPTTQARLLAYLFSLTDEAVAITDRKARHEAFNKWLMKHSAGNLAWMTNRGDLNTHELVGQRNNAQALFLIECSQEAPEAGNNRFTVTFNLTVQYSRTNRIIMDYPISVNNREVSDKFIPMARSVRAVNTGAFMWQNKAVSEYWNRQYKVKGPIPIKYPWWDPWEVPRDSIVSIKHFKPIMTAAFTIDDRSNPEGVTKIDVINGLPGYKPNDQIADLLRKGKNKVLGYLNTYVNLAVYAHDYQVDRDLLDFDGEILTIKSRRIEPIYRLVLSVNPSPVNMPAININWVMIATIITKKEGV